MPTITDLPDELIARMFESTNPYTLVSMHQVCRSWYRILSENASGTLWNRLQTVGPRLGKKRHATLYEDKLHTRRRLIWLAARAAGCVTFSSCNWKPASFETPDRYLFEYHLPYFIGRLHGQSRALQLVLKTGESELVR